MRRSKIAVGLAACAMLVWGVGGCDSKTEETPPATGSSTSSLAKSASPPGSAAASTPPPSASTAPVAQDTPDAGNAPSATSATASAAPAPAPSAVTPASGATYAALDVMKHVPAAATCTNGRVFIDFGKLARSEGLRPLIAKIDTKVPEIMGGKEGKDVAGALAALKAQGVRPAEDLREIAICMQGTGDAGAFAIGGQFGGKDVLAAIGKIVASHNGTFTRQEESGFVFYTGKNVVIAQVAPNVIAGARTKEALLGLRAAQDRSADWGIAGKLVTLSVQQGSTRVDMELVQKGDGFDYKSVSKAEGAQSDKAKKELAMAKMIFAGMAEELGKKLKPTPFGALADDLKSIKIDSDGTKVTMTAHLVSAHLASATKAFADMSADEIQKQLSQIAH